MIAASLTFIILFAIWEAYEDQRDIKRGKDIDHAASWGYRAVVTCGVLLVIWYVSGASFLRFTISLAACAPIFSAVFRFALNKWRGKDWRYVSPSNWYDWVFIYLSFGAAFNSREAWDEHHGFDYEHSPEYRHDIHGAGLLAYIFELVLSVGLIVAAQYV